MGGSNGGRTAGEIPGLGLAEQRSWRNFAEVSLRLHTALNRELSAEHELTLTDLRLLETLDDSASDSAGMSDLAADLMVAPSQVTRRVCRLEKSGLVKRRSNAGDKRCVLVTITGRGRAALDAAMATYAAVVRRLYLDPLTRPQISGMGESCRRIVEALEADPHPLRSRSLR